MPPAGSAAKKQKQKQTLTLAQLASYDDFLTDALVDHVFYWTTIPKNRNSYHPSRGLREEDITRIIQEEIIVKKDLESAERKLLATDGFRKFFVALKTDKAKDDFKRHMRRYTQVYLPDCPFEVNSTNRYTIVSHEAAITARRFIRRNETVKYLAGTQVNISPEEEREMTARKKDFSIIISARSKCASLFMGPARFANHDCRANAKLMTTSSATIEIIATRNIDVGEEITVTYAENYFGEDNCECLCKTCENQCTNGWTPAEGEVMVKKSIEESAMEGYALRRRRGDESTGSSSRTPSVTPNIRPRVSKSRLRGGKSSRDPLAAGSPTSDALSPDKKLSFDSLVTPPITPSKRRKISATQAVTVPPEALVSSRDSSASGSVRSMSMTSGGNEDGSVTDITEPEKDTPEPSQGQKRSDIIKEEECEEPTEQVLAHAAPFSPQQQGQRCTMAAMAVETLASIKKTSVMASRSIPISSLCNPPSPPSKLAGTSTSGWTATAYSTSIATATARQEDRMSIAAAVCSSIDAKPVVMSDSLTTAGSGRSGLKSMQFDRIPLIKEAFESGRQDRTVQTPKAEAVASIEQDVPSNRNSDMAQALMVEARVPTENPAPVTDDTEVCAKVDETTVEVGAAGKPPAAGLKKRKYQRRTFIKETTPPAKTRTPGDYTLTPLLLSEPQTAWVRCMNCETAFVQQNAYYTKSSCPRCERHSKLYGYIWPKTEKAGPRDQEERILDHRIIHRFLGRDDEARIRGRKRPTGELSETLEDERGKDSGEGEDRAGLRRSGRMRKASIKVACP
ncbi:histone-lysine N-methyltransferase SET9 [Colletotrichum falcatum]|nr:histone-lysine N-methyltransferase SET9 [Colletotrichum falcatum]